MSDKSLQWVIKLETDQVKGPYSTDAICKMILTGAFSGSERICRYPEGEWKQLSKQPEFYEALLESLENPVEVDSKKAQKMEAETIIQLKKSAPRNAVKKETTNELKNSVKHQPPQTQSILVALPPAEIKTKAAAAPRPMQRMPSDIILNNIKKIQNKELKKFIPFIAVCLIAVSLFGYFILSPDAAIKSGWALIAPNKNSSSASMSAAEIKDLKRKALGFVQRSQVEGLLSAQKVLVEVAESAPKDLETLGLLCMVYEQLWPFTKQTVQDVRTVSTVTQMARAINPISSYSESCQATYLITKGQVKEARSLVEKTLDHTVDDNFSLGPFLYLIKGELFEYEQNFINADAYFEQAAQVWPKWILPKLSAARMKLKLGKFAEARNIFQGVAEIDKESKAAWFGLGITEYKGFQNHEKANQYFSTGYSLKQVLPKAFHVEALLNYAQLLLEKNDRSKALEVAQQGFQLNPSHRGLKELVINLGGNDQIENAHGEIVLLGDQFARASDHLAAVAQYKAAFELDPKNSTAALKAAKSLWALNQSREAIAWVEKSIQADPKLILAYALKADYESQRYSFVEAARTLQEAARKSPQSYEILKGQALLEFRKNNMHGAIQFGERALRAYDADVELLTLLAQAHIAYYINSPGSRKEDQEIKVISLKEAQRYSGKAIDLEPSWPESQITYAKLLAATNGPQRGETYLKSLIKSFPYTIEYRIALAESYAQEEKFYEASEVYFQILDIEPKNKKANFGLAESYRLQNKPELAQRYYNSTSALDPSDVEALFSNAKLLLESASGKEAKAKIMQALAKFNVVKEINGNYPRVSYFLAKCYLELGDFTKALDLVKEEKNKNPNIADPYLLAAEIFYRKEQFKECAGEYSMAIKMRPSSAELYVKSSICYRKSDAIEIAEDMLIIAKQKESGYAEIYREQGYIFEKKGANKEARDAFEKYLELSPNALDRSVVESHMKN